MITVILQVLAVISALLSISWLPVTRMAVFDTADGIPRPFTAWNYILEMLWNVLAISCRVIALALFGSQYRYWFAGVVVVQCMFWIACIMYIENDLESLESISDWKCFVVFRLAQGIGYTFNISSSLYWVDIFIMKYPWYVFYWFITMLMNTILISIWFTATADTQLWYRIPATIYVIVGYFMSLFVKTFHTNIRKHNQDTFDWEWEC